MIVIIGISFAFIIYNINESRNQTVLVNQVVEEEKEFLTGKSPERQQPWTFYVLGDEKKESSSRILFNVSQLFNDMKIHWEKRMVLTEEELSDIRRVIVFCDDSINDYVDLPLLAEFIKQGGRVVFAAGLSEGSEDAYLYPILGITEKTIRENYYDYVLKKSILPLEEEKVSYDQYTVSTWISPRESVEIFLMEEKKEVPIIYKNSYEEGSVLVFNTSILNDWHCMGLFVGSLGSYLEEFVYPVLGTKTVFLDHFPMVTYVDDAASMRLYGRTTEAFVRDVVWPVFQNISVTGDTVYTSSVLCIDEEEFVFPNINDELFRTLGKLALRFNGEFVYAVNLPENKKLKCNDEFLDGFRKTFLNYKVTGMNLIGGDRIEEAVSLLSEDILGIRYTPEEYQRNKDMFLVNEDYFLFPEATSDFEGAESGWLTVRSVLASYGMISHVFDINQLLNMDESEGSWDKDKVNIAGFNDDILSKTSFLESKTLSRMNDHVRSYEELEYSYEVNENQIKIQVNNVMKGQTFYLRTEKGIISSSGAEYELISKDYYLIKIQDREVVLELSKEDK